MELSDSQYDNELLNQIAEESPTFKSLITGILKDEECLITDKVWLGSLEDNVCMPVQIQLVTTMEAHKFIDED